MIMSLLYILSIILEVYNFDWNWQWKIIEPLTLYLGRACL